MNDVAVVVSNHNEKVNAIETIDAIKKAGFKNVFIQWYNRDWNPTKEEQLKYIRDVGLNVIFAHLEYHDINSIWLPTPEGDLVVESYIKDIKVCKENNIPMVIMHLTRKTIAPMYNEIGLKRLQKIVDYAKSLDIKVAFENTKIKGYLEYVMDNISNDNVGICFDSGHNHAHFNDELDLSRFKDRVFAVHLHDNDQSDDLHLIPFDGTINWGKLINDLKESNYSGPITLELCYRYQYLNMSVDDFYKKGYEVAKKLEEMFKK